MKAGLLRYVSAHLEQIYIFGVQTRLYAYAVACKLVQHIRRLPYFREGTHTVKFAYDCNCRPFQAFTGSCPAKESCTGAYAY